MELAGQTALVTGASRRVGRAVALGLAERGVNVAFHYGSSGSAAEAREAVAEARAMGVNACAVQADFMDTDAPRRLMSEVTEQLGVCTLLVNSAARYEPSSVGDTAGDFMQHMCVNALAPLLLGEQLAMRLGGSAGKIVNITDAVPLRVSHMGYSLSKAALNELTRLQSIGLAPQVQVNAVALGYILPPAVSGESEGERPAQSEYAERKLAAQTEPLTARAAALGDVLSAVLFFLQNDYVTGETVCVDGGMHV